MSAAVWLSSDEITALAFDSLDQVEFRRRLLEALMRRTRSDLGVFASAGHPLAPVNVAEVAETAGPVCRAARPASVAMQRGQELRRWCEALLEQTNDEAAPHRRRCRVIRAAAPGELHGCLVLSWCGRDDTGALLALSREKPGDFSEEMAAAVASIRSIVVAVDSVPAAESPDLGIRHALTDRQAQILELVSRGLTNSEVAQVCGVSKFTVRNHLSKMFEQFGAMNRTELTQLFVGEADRTA